MADDRQPPHDETPDQPDATEIQPVDPDATQVRPVDPDATQVRPGGSEASDRWAARASIPDPEQPTELRAPAPDQQWADEEAGRRWWAPVAIGLGALALLGLLAAGIWLIMQARDEPAPGPSPSPTPSATSTVPSRTPTASPTPSPSAPTLLTVPTFITGISAEDAQVLLQRMGLNWRVENRVDPNARPGTVITTMPTPGTAVAPGSTVVLVVAVAPPTSGPPSVPPAASPSEED